MPAVILAEGAIIVNALLLCYGPYSFHFDKYYEQDKVNYAVSEREDRVTDLTTLTRMTGCTGMYWAANGLF